MKTFDIYKHPTLGYEAVKRGFSWPGFFLGGIWALSKRMSVGGGVLLAAWLILLAAQSDAEAKSDTVTALVLLLVELGLAVVVGILGNSRWAQSMARRGFDHLGTFDAEEPDGAIAGFVKNRDTAASKSSA